MPFAPSLSKKPSLGHRLSARKSVDQETAVAGWLRCQHIEQRLGDWFIAWGPCVPASFFEDLALSDQLAAFVHLSWDGKDSPQVPAGLRKDIEKKSGWQELSENGYLKTREAAGMAQVPAGFTGEFLQWLNTGFREADEIFQRARSRIGKS